MPGSWGLGGDELAGVRVDVVEVVVVVVVVVVGVVRWHLLDAGGDAPHLLHVRLRVRPAPRPRPFVPPSPLGAHAPSRLSHSARGALALAPGPLCSPLPVPRVSPPVSHALARPLTHRLSPRSREVSRESWDYSLSIWTKHLCSAPMQWIMPWEQSWSRSERMVPMSLWPFGVEFWQRGNTALGLQGKKRHMPLSAPCASGPGILVLQPIVVCTDHQSLQSWHKQHVDTSPGPAARRAWWHKTLAKFDLSVVYVPGKDNTVADCLSRWAHPARKAWMDISMHGDSEETAEAKRIIEAELSWKKARPNALW